MILYLTIQIINLLALSYIGYFIDSKPEIKPFALVFIGWFIFMNPITTGLILYG